MPVDPTIQTTTALNDLEFRLRRILSSTDTRVVMAEVQRAVASLPLRTDQDAAILATWQEERRRLMDEAAIARDAANRAIAGVEDTARCQERRGNLEAARDLREVAGMMRKGMEGQQGQQ